MIEGHLYKLAEDDPAVKEAFLQRGSKPEAWAKAQKSIVENFSKQFEAKPDEAINEDREAVIAASKSQSKPEELDESKIMSIPKADFNELQAKHGVKPYGL